MSATEELEAEEAPKMAGAPAWMATFGDMMSLLLCFFVLLLSFATMDVIKFRDMAGSLKDAFGVQTQAPGDFEASSTTPVELEQPSKLVESPEPEIVQQTAEEDADADLLRDIEQVIEERSLHGVMEAVPGENGVTIRVKGALMFESASDQLRTQAMPVLFEIASLAERFDYLISVEGHTDDVPISTDRFPSNWELSAARAVAGVRFLIQAGNVPAERVSATGRAHTRPVVAGSSQDERSRNRRLEFVFYRDRAPEEGTPDRDPERDALSEAVDQALELFRRN